MWTADRTHGIRPDASRSVSDTSSVMRNRVPLVLTWIAAGFLASWACNAVIVHTTTIDQSLPLLGAVATILAWCASEASIATAVPLLMIVEVTVGDEHTRLSLIGVIVAAAFVAAFARKANPFIVAVLALVVLRWIPLRSVVVWRELVVLVAVVVLIAAQRKRTPLSVVATVVLVFVTPAAPTRALLTPFAVAALQPIRFPAAFIFAAIAVFARPPVAGLCFMSAFVLITPLFTARIAQAPFLLAATLVMSLFAWNGAVARGPAFFVRAPDRAPREGIGIALAASESAVLDLPRGTRRLIISAATVSHLGKGKLLGTVAPLVAGARRAASAGPIAIRIGDVADWGYMRREHWFRSRNSFPRQPAGTIHDYGQDAWVDGAGFIDLPPGIARVRVTADPHLPAGAHLQIEGSE
jgi:hypothetical protein